MGTGVRSIDVSEFEAAITQYGSVLACIDTSQSNCFSYGHYRDGIIDGERSGLCMEKVLIVGYTENYYRVRGNKGPDWGENGYFRILRGGSKCAIETNMFVLETAPRRNKPGLDPDTGCPAKFPKYCPDIKTCRAASQFCMTPVKQTSGRRAKRATPNRVRGASVAVSYALDKWKDHPGYPCRALAKHCGHKTIWEKCGGTCGVCKPDGTPTCTDTEDFVGECESSKRYCRMVPALKLKCQLTCDVPPKECSDNKRSTPGIVKMDPPPIGSCYPPEIPNGRVMNRRVFLRKKEKLLVRCNAGYELVGDAAYCEIQNVYNPDTRRLPACIKIGNEKFSGRGESYAGRRDYSMSGRSCENWLKAAHRGSFRSIERGRLLLSGGNHNYCRNIGGEPVPFCFTRTGQLKEYCFDMPGCGGDENDRCSARQVDVYDCSRQYSDDQSVYSDELSKKQVNWIWDHCGAMCCAYAECQ